ncbi:PREDICTED: F-box/LRR-repeat protein At3g58900-like [Camelina sativa]|uniref:F-box/LRR-repeat protein At3g58900-like n=1 Tax=Camelina sativa TaxID=90675 RepID=A0ABM1R2F8_CAMSA|nr:PREDICTED: F-box/LRR-repeat protein At3g58900-like [Camelina sativa]
MDFLSNLPDDLVCHILSFLTTNEAASTSLLSKRWYNLFALVPNLDIDDTVFRYSNCMSSFIDFVDRVIALQGDSPIKRFSLKCQAVRVYPCLVDPCRVNSWISNVLQRGVSDLDLAINIDMKYFLPPNIFHSGTLVELKVRSDDYLYLERCTGREDTFLPLLKTLVLKLAFISCGKMEMFLRSFPVLEELSIDATEWIVCDEYVSSETLRKLTINSYGFGEEINLPDDLVCHILSFLTTNEAASTSLLSKRWYNLFALVPNLDIDDTVFRYSNCMSSFIDFVDRVIALQGDSPIKRFSLKCQAVRVYPCLVDPCRVNSWISNVLQRGVSDLDLAINIDMKYFLPPNIFHSGTLVELKVRSDDYLYLERCTGREDTFLPLLKTLVLKLAFISCGKMEMFLRSFPVLEELSIDATEWIVCDEYVSSETLRKLTINSYGFGEEMLSLKSISFDTPRLVYFDYCDYVAEDYPKVNLTNVVEALLNLRLTEDQYRQARAQKDDQDDVLLRFRNVWKLLSGLRHVQKLYLSCYTLESKVILMFQVY